MAERTLLEKLVTALRGVDVDIEDDSGESPGCLKQDSAVKLAETVVSAACGFDGKLPPEERLGAAFGDHDALWDAVDAKCTELIKNSSGNSRGICLFAADGRSLSRFAKTCNDDGTKTVHFVTARAWRAGPEVTVETWQDNCDPHWERALIEDAKEPDRVVIVRNVHYRYADDLPEGRRGMSGFGGQPFRIRFHDGREIETRNLWQGGTIPPAWRDRLPDNAVFLDQYGDPRHPLVTTTWDALQPGDLVYRPGKRITVERASMVEEGVHCRITVEGRDQDGKPASDSWAGGPAAYVSRPDPLTP